jgi:hypothetical protein
MERFENRVFELIKFYREIVNEINIQDKRIGKNCFIPMFKEFRSIYFICESVRNKMNYDKKIVTDFDLCEIAYSIFFNGIGIESNKLRRQFSPKLNPILIEIDKEIYEIQKNYSKHTDSNSKPYIHFKDGKHEWKTGNLSEILELHKKATQNGKNEFIYEPKYYPYDGHITRLGHYYRHLFEIVRYIVSHEKSLIDHTQTLNYLKLLRTQMSNHEQLLLYYNGVVGVGDKWLNDTKNNNANYFIDYFMIHNVPFPLADFGIPIEEKFADLIAKNEGYFEWEWSGK